MDKKELLENYTAEQLADMVVKYQNTFEMFKFADTLAKTELFDNPLVAAYETEIRIKNDRIKTLEDELENKRKISVIVGGITKTYSVEEVGNIVRAYEDISHCKEHNGDNIQSEQYSQIASLNKEIAKLQSEKKKNKDEINCLKEHIDRIQTTINQIDDILNELFGVTHDFAKPDEFKKILKEKIESSKTIVDFLPTEPIKVVDMLINTSLATGGIIKDGKTIKEFYERLFNISELRQIAEHLLIYCNANGEREG